MKEAGHRYERLTEELRAAYDGSAADRDATSKSAWKLAERAGFLDRLRREGKTRLLEIGAGTGQDGLFFQQSGIGVVATDLSPEMLDRCRAKGLEAYTMDVLHLDFPRGSFDAIYAFNCLLHVPNADLPRALSAIRALLSPDGLFFLGTYGGEPFEGIAPDDWHEPPRFFSFRSDEQLEAFVGECFEMLDFHVVGSDGNRFQSLTLRPLGG